MSPERGSVFQQVRPWPPASQGLPFTWAASHPPKASVGPPPSPEACRSVLLTRPPDLALLSWVTLAYSLNLACCFWGCSWRGEGGLSPESLGVLPTYGCSK